MSKQKIITKIIKYKMSKQKIKKRKINYILEIETDTDFKEKLIVDFVNSLPIYLKGFLLGKSNKFEVREIN